jgi:hypothetical protein
VLPRRPFIDDAPEPTTRPWSTSTGSRHGQRRPPATANAAAITTNPTTMHHSTGAVDAAHQSGDVRVCLATEKPPTSVTISTRPATNSTTETTRSHRPIRFSRVMSSAEFGAQLPLCRRRWSPLIPTKSSAPSADSRPRRPRPPPRDGRTRPPDRRSC